MRSALQLTALPLALGLSCAPASSPQAAAPAVRPASSSANTFETPRPPAQYRRVETASRRDWPEESEPEYLLLSGQRLLERAGEYEVAETAGAAPLVSGAHAPALAGGGFLFWSRDGLYRTRSFMGRLQPLAATSFAPQRVSFGPGYLLVSSNDGPRVVLDSRTGAERAPTPLGLVDVASSDARVVVALELGRAAVSLDRGLSFREVQDELGGVVTALSREPLGFVVDGSTLLSLTTSGGLVRAPLPSPHKPKDPRWKLPETPLERAVGHGVLRASGRALVAAGAALAEVDVQSGKLLSVGQALLPGAQDCDLVEHGDELLLKCTTSDALTFVSQPESGRSVIERSFRGKPDVLVGFGQLAVEGSCEGTGSPLAVCLRSAGSWRTLASPEPQPASDGGAPPPGTLPAAPAGEQARGYALKADGGAIAFVDGTRKGYVDLKTGHFTSLDQERSRAYDPSSRCVVDGAGLLRCLTRDGPLSFAADGKSDPRPVRFQWLGGSGERALGLDRQNQLFQSNDWGRTWVEVATPVVMDRGADSASRCSEVGCRVGAWLRLGWEARPPTRAPAPEPVALAKPATPPRPALICKRLREPSIATSPALVPQTEPRQREPGLGNDVLPGNYFRMPILAMATHQTSGDSTGLRGVLSGVLSEARDGSGMVITNRPLQLRFVDFLDAQARKQSASITWAELVRAARSAGSSTPSLTFEDQLTLQTTPVLAREPGKSAGFLLNHETLSLWIRPGRVTPLPFETNDGSWTVLSAVAEADSALSLLVDDAGGVRRVVRFASGAISESFALPTDVALGGESATPDALAVSADGEVATLRFTSGAGPPSKEYPALAFRPGKVEPLAPWSSLRLASDATCADKAGYRAFVLPGESWLTLAGAPNQVVDDDWGMVAAVRWSSDRVCLEALELADESFSIDDDGLLTRVVASFSDKSEATRLGLSQGYELRQPLECRLGPAR